MLQFVKIVSFLALNLNGCNYVNCRKIKKLPSSYKPAGRVKVAKTDRIATELARH